MSSKCVQERKLLLYGSKTWQVVTENVQRLGTVESGMIRLICCMSLKVRISTADLLLHHGLSAINGMVLRFRGN